MQTPAHAIIDKLPEWAGGPPKDLPPRPGEPGYAAYELQVEGKAAPAPTTHAVPASSSQAAPAPSSQAAPASSSQKAALGPLY